MKNRTVEDSCHNPTFQKLYGRPGIGDVAQDIVETSDNGFISVGLVGFEDRSGDGFIMRTDKKGDMIWKKAVGDKVAGDYLKRVIRLADDNFIAFGPTQLGDNYSNLWIIKFDLSGNVIWNKTVLFPGGIATEGFEMCETTDGGFAIAGATQTVANYAESVVWKFDASGNIKWIMSTPNSDVNAGNTFLGIVNDNDAILVSGYTSDLGFNGDGIVIKMNAATGAIIWQKQYDIDKKYNTFYDIIKKDSSYFINTSITTNQSDDNLQHCILQIDLAGNVRKATRMNPSISKSFEIHSMFPTDDGGFISTQSTPLESVYAQVLLFKISSTGTIEWKKAYPQTPSQRLYRIKPTTDKGVIGIGNTLYRNYGPEEIFIIKTDGLGNTAGCPGVDPPLMVNPVPATVSNLNLLFSPIHLQSSPFSLLITDLNFVSSTYCYSDTLLSCNSVKISGKKVVCNFNDTVTYVATRTAGCSNPITWIKDNEFLQSMSSSDSTIRVFANKAGITKIVAVIFNGCNIILDSVTVTIANSPGAVNLGPDLRLCKGGFLELYAGAGFKSYLWGDGSADSVYKINSTGQYTILTEDYCGNQFRDTINITNAPDIPFDLGPDITICQKDSVNLKAPGNFASYTWSPSYNISNATNQNITVWPSIDTTYSVIAEVSRGCSLKDSIHITINGALPLNLGNDTSICSGNVVVLAAPVGFTRYQWQDNSSLQRYTATATGKYWVHATNTNGCISRDTIEIKNVFSLPRVNIGDSISICPGQTFTFSPGLFQSYDWQDGSTGSSFNTGKPGKYWVRVTDNNGCVNTDTAVITHYNPVPEDFLDTLINTGMCIGGSPIPLTTLGTWRSYLWSDNTSGRTTLAVTPGIYWLEVTNDFNCKARDTLIITGRDCLKGIYFPNVFTPNNDGKNDVFGPVLNFIPQRYKLTVYNRYGESVFESGDPLRGWDGTFKGKLQANNIYAWQCIYQYQGEAVKKISGTVVIIK